MLLRMSSNLGQPAGREYKWDEIWHPVVLIVLYVGHIIEPKRTLLHHCIAIHSFSLKNMSMIFFQYYNGNMDQECN